MDNTDSRLVYNHRKLNNTRVVSTITDLSFFLYDTKILQVDSKNFTFNTGGFITNLTVRTLNIINELYDFGFDVSIRTINKTATVIVQYNNVEYSFTNKKIIERNDNM